MAFTHAELVQKGRRWLEGIGCRVVLCEFGLQEERPDVLGYSNFGIRTFLIECKTSRSDYLADTKKPHRASEELGVGVYRYYLSEKNIIQNVPPKWGLLHATEKTVRLVVGSDPRGYKDPAFKWKANRKREQILMYSACSRLQQQYGHDGVYDSIHRKQDY